MALVHTGVFRDLARAELVSWLSEAVGKVTVICEAELFPLLQLVAPSDFIVSMGVTRVMVLNKDNTLKNQKQSHIFVISPGIYTTRLVCEKIHETPDNKYTILYVPRPSSTCEAILEQEGLSEVVQVGEFNLSLISVDHNLLTLELPQFIKRYYLRKVETQLYDVAQSIVALNGVFGLIPRIIGVGPLSKTIRDISRMMMSECGDDFTQSLKGEPQIGTLVIYDRSQDYLSLFIRPTSYSALLNEYFRGSLGKVEAVIPQNPQPVKVIIDFSTDEVYKQISCLKLYSALEQVLKIMAGILKKELQGRPKLSVLKAMSNQLGSDHQSLKNHALIITRLYSLVDSLEMRKANEIEKIILEGPKKKSKLNLQLGNEEPNEKQCLDYMEECMCARMSWTHVLRFLCLYCNSFYGLPVARFDKLRTQFLQTYGFHHLHLLSRLEDMGLLVSANYYPAAVHQNSQGMSNSALNLSLRIKELTNAKDANELNDLIDVDNEFVEYEDIGMYCEHTPDEMHEMRMNAFANEDNTDKSTNKNIVIFAVGGITYDEIAAFKANALPDQDILFCTTKLINTKNFFDELQIKTNPVPKKKDGK